jgi:chemotaxis protein MotB
LVSYADFATLLLAFFVVLFASSHADRRKAEASVRKAFSGEESAAPEPRGGAAGSTVEAEPPAPSPLPEIDPLQQSMQDLQAQLEGELDAGALSIGIDTRGLVISLKEASYFVSGDDRLAPSAYPVIAKIAGGIASLPNPVRLEGHTDSIPIGNSRFKGNWELSSARAIVVLRLLTSQFAIPERRMSVAGYADTAPIDANDTAEGRARNRRVDVVILRQVVQPELPAVLQ